MLDALHTLTQFVLTALGVAQSSDQVMIAVAIALITLTVVAVASRAFGSHTACGAAVHPRTGVEDSTRVSQSDPDAPGSARPRAPGRVASTARALCFV